MKQEKFEKYLKDNGMEICKDCDSLAPGKHHMEDTECMFGDFIHNMKPYECHKVINHLNETRPKCVTCCKIVIEKEGNEISCCCENKDCSQYED